MFYRFLLSILLWISATISFAQDIIWEESFETDGEGSRYCSSNVFYDGIHDYFNRSDGSNINIVGLQYSLYDGSYFWAGEDLDDTGDPANDGSSVKNIIFKPVNIKGYTDVSFYGLFAAGNDGADGASAYDDEDSVVVYYSVNGGGSFKRALKFASSNDQSNEPLRIDSDYDGIGDSTLLMPAMATFKFNIPDADSVIIKISVSMNAGNEEFGFDHFQIKGTPTGLTPLQTKVSFLYSSDTITEASGEYFIPLKIENLLDTVTVELLISAPDTSNIILHVNSEADTLIYYKINIPDNSLIDGNKSIICSISGITGGYEPEIKEPSAFNLILLDNEVPSGGEIIINEIMYDSKSSTDQEWIELYNTTEDPINISGWYLTDDNGYPADGEGDLVIPDGTFIEGNDYLVISWIEIDDFNGELITDKNSGNRSSAPTLANTGDNLALYSNAFGTGILVDGSDSIFYNDAAPANEGYSIERNLNGDYSGTWITSINDFGNGEIVKGTPGKVNSTYYTSVGFTFSQGLVFEDSSGVAIPIRIINPSDTTETIVGIKCISGDSSQLLSSATQTIIFPSGSSNEQLYNISWRDDNLVAEIDTLMFSIFSVEGGDKIYIGEDSTFQLIIKDNDFTIVNFALDSLEIKEGDSVKVDINITNPHPEEEIVIHFSDLTGDLHYETELTAIHSLTTKSFGMSVKYDAIEEGDEIVYLKISEVLKGNFASVGVDSVLVIKIIDDNPTRVSFAEPSGFANEADSIIYVPLKINFPSEENATEVIIDLIKGDSSDISGFAKARIVFDAQETYIRLLEIPVANDLIRENDEKFIFEIAGVSGGNKSIIGNSNLYELIITDDEASTDKLIINEILFDPPADSIAGDANGDGNRHSTEDEFVEIVNYDSMAVDLSGYVITDDGSIRHLFPNGTIVAPKQAIVVFGGGSPTGNFGNSLVQTASAGSLSLNNSTERIFLINNYDTIASVAYTNAVGDDQSITRFPEIIGGFINHTQLSDDLLTPGYRYNGTAFQVLLPDPLIEVDYPEINFGLVYFPDTSAIYNYLLTSKFLIDSLYTEASDGFEISTDSIYWFSSLKFPPADTLEENLFVRFIPQSADTIIYDNIITHYTEGTDTVSLTVKGTGYRKPQPKLYSGIEEIDFGLQMYNDFSTFQYNLEGEELLDDVLIIAPNGVKLSFDNILFDSVLTIKRDPWAEINKMIFVKLEMDEAQVLEADLLHTTEQADSLVIKLKADIIIPQIKFDKVELDFSNQLVNDVSEVYPIILTASSVINDVSVFSTVGFEISGDPDFKEAVERLVFTPNSKRQLEERLYVRFLPEELMAYDGMISAYSEGSDTVKFLLKGTGVKPVASFSEERIDFGIAMNDEVIESNIFISASSLVDDLHLQAPEGFLISRTEELLDFSPSLSLSADENNKLQDTIYIVFQSAETGITTGAVTCTSKGLDTTKIDVVGEKLVPQIKLSSALLDIGNFSPGIQSEVFYYEIEGTSILDSLIVESFGEIELETESFFNNPETLISIKADKDRKIKQKIFFRLNTSAEGNFIDSINHYGAGLKDVHIRIKGVAQKITGIDSHLNNDFKVYPVPANEFLFVEATGKFIFELISLNGKEVLNKQGYISCVIDTSTIEPGIYLLKLTDSEGMSSSFKILIEH